MNTFFAGSAIALASYVVMAGKPFDSAEVSTSAVSKEVQSPAPPQMGPAILPKALVPPKRSLPLQVEATEALLARV